MQTKEVYLQISLAKFRKAQSLEFCALRIKKKLQKFQRRKDFPVKHTYFISCEEDHEPSFIRLKYLNKTCKRKYTLLGDIHDYAKIRKISFEASAVRNILLEHEFRSH